MAMTDADDRWFVDTNVLVYATDKGSPFHNEANERLRSARELGVVLCISAQVLREYISAATKSAIPGQPVPWSSILDNCLRFRRMFKILPEGEETAAKLCELLAAVPAIGKQVHDANIVATMLVHSIPALLTHNTADFERYAGFISLYPAVKAR
jgi:predicted nucleic acid-binding protein